jgi:hypothetical protein
MSALPTIRKRSTRVELSARELALIDAAMFDATVRLLKDSKAFDITNPDDDDSLMECRMEADIIRGIQRKLEFARKQIELDAAQ